MNKNKRQIILLAVVFILVLGWLVINLVTNYSTDTLMLLIITLIIFGGGFIFVVHNMLEHYRNNRYAISLAEKEKNNPYEELIIKSVDGKLKDILKQTLKEKDIRNIQGIDTVFYKKMVSITYDYKKYNVLFDIKDDNIVYNIYEPEHYLTKLGKHELFVSLNSDHNLDINPSNEQSLHDFINKFVMSIEKINREIDAFEEKLNSLPEPDCYRILHHNQDHKSNYWINILIASVIFAAASVVEFLGYKEIINPEEVKMLHILTSIFKVMAFVILLDIPYTVPSKEVYAKKMQTSHYVIIIICSLFNRFWSISDSC